MKIWIVAVLKVKFLPILGVYWTWAAQQPALHCISWCSGRLCWVTTIFQSTPEPIWLCPSWQHDGFSNNTTWGLIGHVYSAAVSTLGLYAPKYPPTPMDGERPKFFAILQRSIVFELTDNSLTKFGTKWWTKTHPYLQRLSLWWMLLLYSILITSPLLPVKLWIVEPSRTVLRVTFSVLFWLCPNFFKVCCRHHILQFFIFTKYS